MKFIFKLFAFVLVFFVLVVIGINIFAKQALVFGIEKVTGAPAKVGSFHLDLMKQQISIKEFILYNPPGYPKTPLIDIPEVTVAIKTESLLKGRADLPLVVLNLREVSLIKNAQGKLNVDSLNFVQKPEEQKTKTPPGEPKNILFKIDLLKLTIGKVVYQDYSAGGSEPRVKTYDLGINNKEFHDITSPQQLASLLLVQAMTPTAIKSAAVTAVSAIHNIESLTVDKAAGFLNRIKEKLK